MSAISNLNSQNNNQLTHISNSPLTRQEVYSATKADKMASNAKLAFTAAGVAGGICIALKCGIAVVAVASLATPIGWAAVGLLAVGLGVLAVRHAYMQSHKQDTDTVKQLAQAGGLGAMTGLISTLLAPMGVAVGIGAAVILSVEKENTNDILRRRNQVTSHQDY